MIKFYCLFLLFLPLSVFTKGKLRGKLADAGGSPVAYATIQLRGSNSLAVKGDMGKEDGSFDLVVKLGNYTLQVTQFGKMLFAKSLQLTIDLNLGPIKVSVVTTLATVNISGNKPVIRQSFDKLIFNVENSPLKSGYNGLEVSAQSLKLQVNAAGDVLLRNSFPKIMINGRKQNLTGEELSSYLASLNPEMIKSIEIQAQSSANTDVAAKGGVIK